VFQTTVLKINSSPENLIPVKCFRQFQYIIEEAYCTTEDKLMLSLKRLIIVILISGFIKQVCRLF